MNKEYELLSQEELSIIERRARFYCINDLMSPPTIKCFVDGLSKEDFYRLLKTAKLGIQ